MSAAFPIQFLTEIKVVTVHLVAPACVPLSFAQMSMSSCITVPLWASGPVVLTQLPSPPTDFAFCTGICCIRGRLSSWMMGERSGLNLTSTTFSIRTVSGWAHSWSVKVRLVGHHSALSKWKSLTNSSCSRLLSTLSPTGLLWLRTALLPTPNC